MPCKSILFDLDGTLTDSGEGIMNSAALAMTHFGIPLPDRTAMRQFVGPPLQDTFVHFGMNPEDTDEAIEVFRSYYTTIGKFENVPYPGIHNMLSALKDSGYRLLVATSKPEVMAIEILEHFDLAKYFDRICGASLDRSRETKDKVIAYLLDLEGSENDMIMVGDTAFDVIGAAAHKIPCIGVSWGYGNAEDISKAGAVRIADNVSQLQTFIEELT